MLLKFKLLEIKKTKNQFRKPSTSYITKAYSSNLHESL